MTKLKALTLAGAAASALLATPAYGQSTPIYSNADNYLSLFTDFIGNGQIGDQVTFGGTARTVTDIDVEYFLNSGSAVGQLFVRAMDGPVVNGVATPGSVLYDSGQLTLGAGQNHISATGLSLEVPESVTWSVLFSGVDAGEQIGLLYYDPPTVGQSFDDFWQIVGGTWTLMDTPNVKDNFGAVFTAVPEPSTWALLLGGAGMLGFLSFRRKS